MLLTKQHQVYAQGFNRFSIKNLGPDVNTTSNEYAPTVIQGGRRLLFTSDRPDGLGGDDLWVTVDPFTPAVNFKEINTSSSDGAPSISANGQTLYFASSRNTNHGNDVNIWVATLKDSVWVNMHDLGSPVNTTDWESQPSISPDGNRLFFASNRPGKIGGEASSNVDIFVSHKLTDSTWGGPVNLGSKINTGKYDGSPFMAEDGVTLYFSSDGHGGQGGLDLFRSRWIGPSDTDWTDPENIHAINTTFSEFSPAVFNGGRTIYFASDRPGGFGKYDLWVATALEDRVTSLPSDSKLSLFVRHTSSESLLVTIILPLPSTIRLSLFDELGRLVSEVPAVYSDAGEHSFTVPISRLSSGMYYLQLVAGEVLKTIMVPIDR
jgi:Tol biopolymer transport system component